MTTDNKTLADVQPGGRVRLGYGLPPLPEFGINTANHASVRVQGFTPEQMLDYARAALSAQPSPGGQGDIRSEKAATFLRQYLTYLRSSPRQGLRPRWCDVYEALEVAIEALAARQPVNESPMAKMAAALRGKAEAEKAAFDQRVQSGEWGPMPDQYDTRSFCAVCDGSGWKDASENELCPVCEGQGIGTSLAARQPVGEPVVKSVGIDALAKLLEDEAAECEKAWVERADTYMSGRASGFLLAADHFRKIATSQRWSEFLSSPAQAVDLAENMLSVLIEEGVLARNGRVFQKLRALIDSQAAGNK